MKRILLFVIGFVLIIILCCCGNPTVANNDFVEGSLLFDMGANSMDDIEYCKIIDDGVVPEIIIDESDFDLFAKYRYNGNYPSDKLHELIVFPTNKLINISIDEKVFALYVMEDGNIGVRISEEEGFKVYQADKKNQITSDKYDKLVKKYSKWSINWKPHLK